MSKEIRDIVGLYLFVALVTILGVEWLSSCMNGQVVLDVQKPAYTASKLLTVPNSRDSNSATDSIQTVSGPNVEQDTQTPTPDATATPTPNVEAPQPVPATTTSQFYSSPLHTVTSSESTVDFEQPND